MLIGVIADTHNEFDRTERAVQSLRHRGAEAVIHCGDLSTGRIVEICSELPFFFVFGNHDADNVPELEAAADAHGATCLGWGGAVTLASRQVAVAHGHMTMDLSPLLAESPDYLLSGHSHEPRDWAHGSTRRINPGALHRASPYSFATIDLNTDHVEFVSKD